MKKIIYLLLLMIVTKASSIAQTPIWQDDLNSAIGWEFEGNWDWSTPGTVYLPGGPTALNFDMSAVSPIFHIVDLSEELIISHYIQVASAAEITTEIAEISLIIDGVDFVIWNWELINGDWGSPSSGDLIIPISEYAGQDVQLKFRSYGPTSDAWYVWSINNIKLSAIFENDLCAKQISGSNYIGVNQPGSWQIEISNYGQSAQSDYTVELLNIKSGELLGSTTVTNALEPGETAAHLIYWTPEEAENTALYANVISVDDDFVLNDSSGSFFLRVNSNNDYNILVWDNDNGLNTIINPEKGDLIQPSDAITYILNLAGFSHTYSLELPDNINDYDIIIGTLGCYCLS